MTDEQRQEYIRRDNEGIRAMNDAQMAIRAAEQARGMRNAYPACIDNTMQAQAPMNFRPLESQFIPANAAPTMRERFKRWILA